MENEINFIKNNYKRSSTLCKLDFQILSDEFDDRCKNDNDNSDEHRDDPDDVSQHRVIIHEAKHVQQECLEKQTVIKPLSKDIHKKEAASKVEHEQETVQSPEIEQETLKNGTKKEEISVRMNWNEYYRLNVIYNFLEELESDYPSICTVGVIGTSLEGRNLKVSNSDTSNNAVWMDAGIHAREWIAPAVATYIANHIVRNFTTLPTSITSKDWYFHPVVNPDGYEYSHTCDRMWRKNRAWHGGTCVGVDLNRNFSYGWGGNGSSASPVNTFYRGPEPFSEPESCAMRPKNVHCWTQPLPLKSGICPYSPRAGELVRGWNLSTKTLLPILVWDLYLPYLNGLTATCQWTNCTDDDILLNSGISFSVYITLHSYGQVILFPFAYRDELCPDYVRLLEGATIMSRAIHESSGNTYKVGISRDVMYGAAGTSSDWSYGEAGIPFCYLIELRSKKHKFMLPKDEIEETGNEILNGVKALMEFIDDNLKRKTVVERA